MKAVPIYILIFITLHLGTGICGTEKYSEPKNCPDICKKTKLDASRTLKYINRHTTNTEAISHAEDTLNLILYSMKSIDSLEQLARNITYDQQKSFISARTSFIISCQEIAPLLCRMYFIIGNEAKIQNQKLRKAYCITNCTTKSYLKTHNRQLEKYYNFILHNERLDTNFYTKFPKANTLFFNIVDSPCDSLGFSYKEGASEHYNSSRLQRERYLLCRMASDVAALSRILELMQGEERIPNNAKQIRITANTLKDCANDLLKRLNAHSYPLAVRESDPAFEGDPFAVFQAYQRQAEQAARTAQAALEGVRQARGR